MILHANRAHPQGVRLARQPHRLRFAIRGQRLSMRGHPRLGRVVDGPHRLRPPLDGDVLGMCLLQHMQIAQQVNPTTLVLARIVVIADRAVTHQMAGERTVQDALHDGLHTGPVVLIGTHRIVTGRAEAPDRAVLAVLAPPGLITVQDAALPGLRFERIHSGRYGLAHDVQDYLDAADTQDQLVETAQIAADGGQRQVQRGTQIGDQAEARRTPIQLRPSPCLQRSSFGLCQRWWQTGHQRLMTRCSTISTGTGGGNSITCRV